MTTPEAKRPTTQLEMARKLLVPGSIYTYGAYRQARELAEAVIAANAPTSEPS